MTTNVASRRVSEPVLQLIMIVILSVMTLIGFVAGWWLSDPAHRAFLTTWDNLGAPPAEPQSIVAATSSTVVVQAAGGGFYSCARDDEAQCWRALPSAPTVAQPRPCPEPREFAVPEPPEMTLDLASVITCQGDTQTRTEYIIRDTGEVWTWQYSVRDPAAGFSPFWAVAGGFVGLLDGAVTSFILWRLRPRS